MVSLATLTSHQPQNFAQRCQRVTQKALDEGYLHKLFPDAKRQGRELRAGSIYGGYGDSFGVNTATGKWADFAESDHRGGDLVSLLAARENLTPGQALEYLEQELGIARLPQKPRKALPSAPTVGTPSRVWRYTDAEGRELYQAHRWEKEGHRKSCRSVGLADGVEKVPLHLPEVLKAVKSGKLVFIVEGEPKVDLLKSWNIIATTFINGAKGYQHGMAKWFAGAGVIILVDSDEPGREFGRRVAADIARLDNQGVKVIELPGARFEGYDLVDWVEDGGDYKRLANLVKDAPFFEVMAEQRRPLQCDPAEFSGLQDLNRAPEQYKWLIENSLRRGQLGLICGPPGCGKGVFTLQLSTALAASRQAFDFWDISSPARVLYISAEDDETVLHNRLYYILHQLPEKDRRSAAENLARMPVQGLVNICRGDKSTGTAATENLDDLRALVEQWRPDLLVLDTLARFFGVDENDNLAVTAACGLLEEIISAHKCNILLIHHISKQGGDLATDKKKMYAALNQTAIRGASALAGAVRWALLMAPLSSEMAEEIIGLEAKGKPHGTYVAARVAKKNAGPSETICYLEKSEHGLMSRVYPAGEEEKQEAVMSDAYQLVAEVDKRGMTGEPPLSFSRGGRDAFAWGTSRNKKAIEAALENELLVKTKKANGNGYILSLPPTIASDGEREIESQ